MTLNRLRALVEPLSIASECGLGCATHTIALFLEACSRFVPGGAPLPPLSLVFLRGGGTAGPSVISDVATELNRDAADPGRIVTPCLTSDPLIPLSAALSGQW